MISSDPEGGSIDPTAWYDETPFMEVSHIEPAARYGGATFTDFAKRFD